MTARTVVMLGQLEGQFECRVAVNQLRYAWRAVLHETRTIGQQVSGRQRLELEVRGWSTELLKGMSLPEYGRLKEKALFARLALDYLSEADWRTLAQAFCEPI